MAIRYKIIASDLDGTLFNNMSRISSENIEAIKMLTNKGAHFVLSTGRTLSEIPVELADLPDVRYMIHSNGAVVYDKQTGHRILNCISNNTSCGIFDMLYKYECHITYRHNGNCFVDALFQNDEFFEYFNVCNEHRTSVRNFAVYLDNFKEIAYNADNVEVISVFFHNKNDKIACKTYFEKTGVLRVVEASEYNLEIMNIDAGKGNALCALANMIGVSPSECISIGDSDNDSSIIQAAGLGLAVSNACSSLKNIADNTICSNEEHVAKYVLTHYFN